jgi:hypothetical protein
MANSAGFDQGLDRVSMTNWKQAGERLQQREDMLECDGERDNLDGIGAAGFNVDTGGITQGTGSVSGIVINEREWPAGLEGPGSLIMGSQAGSVEAVQHFEDTLRERSEDQGTAHNPSCNNQEWAGKLSM